MSAVVTEVSLGRELAAICGSANILEEPAKLESYSIDGVQPAIAISPGSAEEICAILKYASARNLTVVPAGGFTAQEFGGAPERMDIVLRTERLHLITHFDPGDLTFGAGAGFTITQIDSHLAPHGLFLPIDSAQPESATLGGTLATAAHGPLKHGYGGAREFCIGIQFVTGDGKLVKGGGRVVKNVAGYDLMKLLIGSFGSLGVIVNASYKLFPRPGYSNQTRTFALDFSSLTKAIVFRDRIRRSPLNPICFEILSSRALEYMTVFVPPARDPDEFAPTQRIVIHEKWRLLLRAVGSERVLARYRKELGSVVTEEIEAESETALWRCLSNFQTALAARHRNFMLINLGAAVADVELAIRAAEQAAIDNNFLPAFIGRVAMGSLVAAFIPLAVDPPSAMQYANAISALRASLPPGATAVVARCPREAKQHFSVWGSSTADIISMRAVKRALDPKGILNRGRFLV